MRILLASDLHYRLRQYDWLLAAAGRFDAVVIAGDHLDIASPVPADVQIAALSPTLRHLAARVPLLVCSGNHDLDARGIDGEKTARWIAVLQGTGVTTDGGTASIAGALFSVCPWWDGPVARARVEAQLAAAAALRPADMPWVWVYHAPPPGPLSWTGRRHFGDEVLLQLVERHAPTAVLCGHVHEAPFKPGGAWAGQVGGTWIFNAGRQPGDVPACIEIDLGARHARWLSIEGVEERTLAPAAQ